MLHAVPRPLRPERETSWVNPDLVPNCEHGESYSMEIHVAKLAWNLSRQLSPPFPPPEAAHGLSTC